MEDINDYEESVEDSPRKAASGDLCIKLTALALAASVGWAAGLGGLLLSLVRDHGLGLSIAVLMAASLFGFSMKTRSGKVVERIATAAATTLVLYGVVTGWVEVATTGNYGEAPFLVNPGPGIAINLAVAAFIFCLVRHSKMEEDVVEHRWTMVCLPILLSGAAFLAMAVLSWMAYEDVRRTAEIAASMEAQIQQLRTLTAPVSE